MDRLGRVYTVRSTYSSSQDFFTTEELLSDLVDQYRGEIGDTGDGVGGRDMEFIFNSRNDRDDFLEAVEVSGIKFSYLSSYNR